MILPINQRKKLEEKLRSYRKRFIEYSLLKKIIEKFAPNYKIKTLCARKLVSPIKKWELYLNLLYEGIVLSTTILAKYGKGKQYMVGWLYLYNQYGYTTQLADRMTVYNTSIHGKRIIAWAKFIFQKVRPSFFRWKISKKSKWETYYLMSPERALIQLIKDTNGELEFADDIYNLLQYWTVDKEKLIELSQKYCSKSVQHLITIFLEKWQKSSK